MSEIIPKIGIFESSIFATGSINLGKNAKHKMKTGKGKEASKNRIPVNS